MSARKLWLRLGREGITAVRAFVEGCEHQGNAAAARFWAEIATQLQAMAQRESVASGVDPAVANPRPRGGTWRLMQRIERYRHRAMEAARAAGSEALQPQMLEIVTHWLELAREAEALALESTARKTARRRGGLH